ncbi:MAG: D-lyxose/D-mannose family sugar isomerase [Draconibacterium sp.]|nr:D-lyxose/D-mannose family sugar isomerase [Draconibacterium sp.]
MIRRSEYNKIQKIAAEKIKQAGIIIRDDETENIKVADFGLSDVHSEGGQILTFFETERISAKIIVLLPNQTLPEHWHPPVGNDPGKEEIIRAISGEMRFYIPGEGEIKEGFIPKGKKDCYTMRKEVILQPGEQIILQPGTKHWFQAGTEGAVMYSFSTCVRDGLDGFTDPEIVRETKILEDEEL